MAPLFRTEEISFHGPKPTVPCAAQAAVSQPFDSNLLSFHFLGFKLHFKSEEKRAFILNIKEQRMSRLLRGPALFLLLLLITALPTLAQVSQPNISTGEGNAPLQVMHNHVRPVVSSGQAVPVGVLPQTQRLKLAIMLPLRNQPELTDLLSRLYDPSSPNFHQFLSVDQFTTQFGPTVADHQAVLDFAAANGLTVTGTHANRLVVDVEGSVAQVEKAFHVSMRTFQHPTENRTFFSTDREPSMALSVPIQHIGGLNDFSRPKSHMKRLPATATANAIHPNAGGSGPAGAFRPSDMRAAYAGNTTLTGTGQSVAMVEFDGYNMADVVSDMGGTAINVPITNVLIDGAAAGSDGDDGEQALDVAQAIGMAPGLASVRVYIAPGTTAIGVGDVDMFNKIATDNISKSISCSWGWSPDDITQNNPIFQEYQAQGQSFFVASGDSGAYTGSNTTDSSFPAEDVFAIAVGATDLTTTGAGGPWASETAWPDSSGGPADDGFAIPSYQSGVASTANGGSTTVRNVPDVAMEGNFDNIACSNGSCNEQTGGTSYASPRWAAFIALVNQQSVAAGHGTVGFINPAIYAIGKSTSFTSDFHDITSGNNRNAQGKSFNAVAGYDLVTGWGSPIGQTMINALAGAATPDFSIGASPASLSVTQGSSGSSTISVTDIGGFTGSVTLSASGLPAGVTASFGTNPATSTSVLTLTASATATTGAATVTITGTSGTLTHTTTVSLTVTAAAAPNFALSAAPASVSVTQGSTGTSTITVTPSGGFTGAVTLAASGLPAGVTAAFGTNPATSTSVLTFTASATATTGAATVTVTGTSGTLSHSTTISLTVSATGGTPTNVIVNGGFETGTTTAPPWTLTAGVLNTSASEPPHAGTKDAWLDGYGTTHTDTATQTVTIPATATTATLTFFLHIDTAETTTTTAFDTLTVQVLNSAGTVLQTLGTFSNLNKAAGYTQHSLPITITSIKGQSVQIKFTGKEDASLQTSFVIDDVALNVQ
jgi:subtilase family serine protease